MKPIDYENEIINFFLTDPFYSEIVPPKIDPRADNLIEIGLLDSVGILNFILFIQRSYGVEISLEDLSEANFATVERIVKYLSLKAQL